MKPKKPETAPQDDLFRNRLCNLINMRHELVLLADSIDWSFFEDVIEPLYADEGRPGLPVQFMVGLHILKHVFDLSDEEVCARWVESPYFQYFTGEDFFQHSFPHDRSSMSRWRERVGEEEMARLVQESLRIAHKEGALRTKDMQRVTVDTTVQPKNITFPTDAKLAFRSIVRLGKLAKKHGVTLRQSYVRVAKLALIRAQRYAHAKQFKRMRRELKFLRIRLGRMIRDIGRKIEGDLALEAIFAPELSKAIRVKTQKRRQDTPKIYSLHEPHVLCIGKGKAHKPYEFGSKVSVTTTNARAPGGQFVLHIKSLRGLPYDGHTLDDVLKETQAWTGVEIERSHVDKGYAGHNHAKKHRVFRSGQRRGVTAQIKREMKRRAAVEPVIGHMKEDGRLGRNFLKGHHGDRLNAILCGAAHNFRLLLTWFAAFFVQFLLRFIWPGYRPIEKPA